MAQSGSQFGNPSRDLPAAADFDRARQAMLVAFRALIAADRITADQEVNATAHAMRDLLAMEGLS